MTASRFEVIERPMTGKQLAEHLDMRPETIYRASARGDLVGHVPTGEHRKRYLAEDVNRWLRGES